MAQLVINNIDPILIYKLETLARQHERSLQEELQYILEQATQPVTNQNQSVDIATAREMVTQIQEMFAGRTFRDSAELIREDRERWGFQG
ncbi:FitA-like ribbon-helix-helix domain-containing protein [Scytonema sp. NUACC26]|uniref:FitA-like ribbon-helix-helix domain-containing protein n=1 Tax=Scytonema sp. NUACC26 TaxID=3140176 RepID=UPI0034DBBA2F